MGRVRERTEEEREREKSHLEEVLKKSIEGGQKTHHIEGKELLFFLINFH